METRLPYLTRALPGTGGVLRATPEDFVVEEIPAYLPSGEGEHTWVRIEKRDMTTPFAVERMAKALGVPARDAGWAGLKDRHAVTTQWVSLPRVDPAAVEALRIEGLRVLEVSRHRNKLRTGHLHGNRFTLRLTAIADPPLAAARARDIATELQMRGCPNYYGEQRFGREGDNAERGFAWLRGGPAPREAFLRKMLVSAAQSELFNRWLARRVEEGMLDRYVDGDLAARHPVGGPWPVDASEAPGLYASRGASATGPVFGTAMRWPTGEARRREEAVLAEASLTTDHFAVARDLGEGTRRHARVVFDGGLEVTEEEAAIRVSFALPAGAYATVVMREITKSEEVG